MVIKYSPSLSANTSPFPQETDELDTYIKRLEKQKFYLPPAYRVILLNDDYTPMDFVVQILNTIFHKSKADSITIMLYIHHYGSAIGGIFTREIAETKIREVTMTARQHQYPLQCIMEKD